MREIVAEQITDLVARLCQTANTDLGNDVMNALSKAYQTEESPVGKDCLQRLIENAKIAAAESMPICQDTGMAIVFVEYGQEVVIKDGDFAQAIHEGVRRGYTGGYLRGSMVQDPLQRVNTGDNTPAVIHTRIVSGEHLKIIVAPKGFGSENMSRLKMLTPAEGIEGVKKFIIETVSLAGANPCPPIVVGVGIGGSMEMAALLAKEALLREIGTPNSKQDLINLESELLVSINDLGIGPQGLGGRCTALAVHVMTYPTHIAGLPVAVNISCHVTRHKSGTI
ncbi:MAG TPA: fumarate hydratase [Firmicutes bacterium]|nr:fumarate hydratase [Bacillota bacterium]